MMSFIIHPDYLLERARTRPTASSCLSRGAPRANKARGLLYLVPSERVVEAAESDDDRAGERKAADYRTR